MGPITGRAILEGPLQEFLSGSFGTEIIYSFVIIICSLMIYIGTKELYELSSHKGLKYFRQAFIFFAIAYFVRSFIKFTIHYFNIGMILDLPPQKAGIITGHLTLFFFMYFSSMAIFYLLYSVMWKKWNGKSNKIYIFHTLALVIGILSILFRNSIIYLQLNLALFLVVLYVVHISKKETNKKKKPNKHNLHVIYYLLSFFWILNIVDILIPEFFQTFQLLIYIASISIFMTMLYKVLKNAGAN